ncbi:class II aldolase/adducin family protein [Gammaproteobacteria bacterium]|nr:class II aldolase/adducin family protein [Gammaproteobacteria bacterium]
MQNSTSTRALINDFCDEIGRDRLLVQGAGGNISWKEENILYVKASGMKLSAAKEKNIFVPVGLLELQQDLAEEKFNIKPIALPEGDTQLKPSIETLMHAMLPFKFVLHLHAIDTLAILVRKNAKSIISNELKDAFNYSFVDYHQPGELLAKAIYRSIEKSCPDIIFLKNHGIVIGSNSLDDLSALLKKINSIFKPSNSTLVKPTRLRNTPSNLMGYTLIHEEDLLSLVSDEALFTRLKNCWVLYPDHVVFLGPKPLIFDDAESFELFLQNSPPPSLVFIKNMGVYVDSQFTLAQLEQLRCYYDVISRQDSNNLIESLTSEDISKLMNWDAEKYRIEMSNQ